MNISNQSHYHCLIDPVNQTVVSQGETELDDMAPKEFESRLLEQWGLKKLPTMKDRETLKLDYFYATNLIRPMRSVLTFTKGPFVGIRSVMGSPYPGHEEILPYEYGSEKSMPATYSEFPLPENPPDYLVKELFYDGQAIVESRTACIECLKAAVSSGFPPGSLAELLRLTELLVASTGGHGLHPHPLPFYGDNEADSVIMILDLVLYAIIEEAGTDTLPQDVIQAYKQRRENSDISEDILRQNLAWMKSDAT